MIKLPISSSNTPPNDGLALFYLFEGFFGTLALLLSAALLLDGADESAALFIPSFMALVSIPGYVLQWGYVQYLRGKLGEKGRWRLWLGTMVLNLLLVPAVLVPTGVVSTLGSKDEALYFMTPIVINMLVVSGLGVVGFWREHRALAA